MGAFLEKVLSGSQTLLGFSSRVWGLVGQGRAVSLAAGKEERPWSQPDFCFTMSH